MLNDEPWFKKDPKARESEIKDFISHKFWRKYDRSLGHMERSRKETGREEVAGPEAHVCLVF